MNVGSPERRIKSLEKAFLSTVEQELSDYLDILEKTLKEDFERDEKNKQSRNAKARKDN